MIGENEHYMRAGQANNHYADEKGRKTGNKPQNINTRLEEGKKFAGGINLCEDRIGGSPEL